MHVDMKEKELIVIGKKIEERKYKISDAMKIEGEDTQSGQIRIELIQLFSDGLQHGVETTLANITDWAEKIGNLAIEHGAQLDETLKGTAVIRSFLWEELEQIIKEDDRFNLDTVFRVTRTIDPLLDQAIYAYSTSFVQAHKASMDEAQQEFLKLSAPVVPLMEGVAVLPIIGSVNDERAYYLMDTTLDEATRRQLNYLLIDLSGVTVIDTMVANSIGNIISSLELVGVTAILAGIRPEVAQTMVTLGIDFSDIKTYNSLQQALSVHVFTK
ncbi:STAS domain-containing protein [Halobacillus litoralis]|uniref:Anti-anti-sigma factor n=1 Tax=Halobacillus litoralis TaxID=45668 RepID=A0A410MA49_9BACI|nr:STAS domain-containing protein [Halobacillus litoralis]QAS51548.1 anti-anti-sigma factor [Halobacillus litoralis]